MPGLQFNNISLGVAHVAEREAAGAGDVEGDDLAVVASTGGEDFIAFLCDIRNFEGDVSEAVAGDFGAGRFVGVLELEDFQSGAVGTVAREAEMMAASAGVWASGEGFEFFAFVIAFTADGDALEEALIKIGEAFPVARDEIGVGVADLCLHEMLFAEAEELRGFGGWNLGDVVCHWVPNDGEVEIGGAF